jgi:hypothetical protein
MIRIGLFHFSTKVIVCRLLEQCRLFFSHAPPKSQFVKKSSLVVLYILWVLKNTIMSTKVLKRLLCIPAKWMQNTCQLDNTSQTSCPYFPLLSVAHEKRTKTPTTFLSR